MRARSTATLAFAALALSPLQGRAAPPRGSGGPAPTNVVIILMDEVGTDFLELFHEVNPYSGDDPFTSNLYVHAPRLAELAAGGVRFTNAYAQPMCSATRAAMLTGAYATRTGVGDIFKWPSPHYVGAVTDFGDPGFDPPTLPETLKAWDSSYLSGIFGKWHLAMPTWEMEPSTGQECFMGWASIPQRGGFDAWRCIFNGLDNAPLPPITNGYCAGYYNFIVNEGDEHSEAVQVTDTYATIDQFDSALAWCEDRTEPFLCVITPNASHSPFQDLPPVGFVDTDEYKALGTFNAFTRFCAALEALDVMLGEFMDGLDSAGLADDTLIIVMGDNGTPEVVLEHARRRFSAAVSGSDCSAPTLVLGSNKKLGTTYDAILGTPSTGDGRFKGTVYEKGVRVPLIISGAGVDGSGGRINRALVQVEDIFPTVADVLGASYDASQVDGISFADLLADESLDDFPLDHARDFVWSQRFRRTGHAAVSSEQDEHRIGCSLNIPGAGRFKIVRDALAGSDEFYQLTDLAGLDVDPFELDAIDYSDPLYSDLYDLVAAKIDEIMGEASSGSTCVDPPAPVDCVPVANSTDAPALLGTSGTTHVECNDLVLHVTGAVPNQSARFFYGQTPVASAPAGDGNLCVCASGGCETHRLDIFTIDDDGNGSFALDLTNLPTGGDIAAGETWYFQLWYRDPFGDLGSGFNFSNSLEITFCD